MKEFPSTWYFNAVTLRDRPDIRREWVAQVIAQPLAREVQADGRFRVWGAVPEKPGYYLRVILLPDGFTVHNAFWDRGFARRMKRGAQP